MSDDNNWHRYQTNDHGHDVNALGYDRNGRWRGTSSDQPQTSSNSSSTSSGNVAAGGSGLGLIIGLIVAAYILEKHSDYIYCIGGIIVVCVISGFILYLKTKRSYFNGLIILAGIGAIIAVLILSPSKIFYFFRTNRISLVTSFSILFTLIIIGSILRKKSNKPKLVILICTLSAIGLISGVIYTGPRQLKKSYISIERFIKNTKQKIPLGQKVIKEP